LCCHQAYQRIAGTCAFCSRDCATCTPGATGGICTACAAGFSYTYPNTCTSTATATTCVAGEYIDAGNVCRKCPAGTFGATIPLVGAQCSGPCAPGTYSVLGSTACSATAACPIGQYKNQTSGTCVTCSGATPVVAATGTACAASCPAGTLNVNGLCTPSAADATYTSVFAIGANDNLGVMQCCPVTMWALSPTAAFKGVSFEVQNGVNSYTASAGQCFGCATQIMPSVTTGARMHFRHSLVRMSYRTFPRPLRWLLSSLCLFDLSCCFAHMHRWIPAHLQRSVLVDSLVSDGDLFPSVSVSPRDPDGLGRLVAQV
jgi:hypothetical protein